jgi:hypothetical protein
MNQISTKSSKSSVQLLHEADIPVNLGISLPALSLFNNIADGLKQQ